MQRFLAEKLEEHFQANKKLLDELFMWFQVGAIAVGAEVILGGVQLAMSH